MRTLYVLFTLSIIFIIALLVCSFIYLDRTSHDKYYYIINRGDFERGDIEIDKYLTEQNIIYKSKINLPFNMGPDKKEIKIEIDRKTNEFKNYEEFEFYRNIKELCTMRNKGGILEFLACARSKFSYIDNIKFENNAQYFDLESLATLLPFIKSYNFRKGGSQFFNAIRYDVKLLPPSMDIIALTSIRDDFIDVDGEKIKTECLIIKTRGIDQGYIWVDKRDRSIIAMEIPEKQIYIKRTEIKKNFVSKDYILKDPLYISQKMYFTANELELYAILSRPSKEGVYPAVILLQGEGSFDNSDFGIFTDISDYLSKNGYVVLRFDYPTEKDKASFKSVSIEDEYSIMKSAIEFLKTFRFVDTEKLGIIGHFDANHILVNYLLNNKNIEAAVMLSPRRLAPLVDMDLDAAATLTDEISKIDKNYANNISECEKKVFEIASGPSKNIKNILGFKIFTERLREIPNLKPLLDLKYLTIPVLIIQGKGGGESYYIKLIERLKSEIEKGGLENFTIVGFRKLNQYLGEITEDEITIDHYNVDKEILQTLAIWLDKVLTPAHSEIVQ